MWLLPAVPLHIQSIANCTCTSSATCLSAISQMTTQQHGNIVQVVCKQHAFFSPKPLHSAKHLSLHTYHALCHAEADKRSLLTLTHVKDRFAWANGLRGISQSNAQQKLFASAAVKSIYENSHATMSDAVAAVGKIISQPQSAHKCRLV